jgi:thiamine-phosphate pyrophosphorylase
MSDCRLYLISPNLVNIETFPESLSEAFEGGDVASFQLRLKSSDKEDIINISKKLIPICHKYKVAFILNDDPELALEVGADGVHLGQNDISLSDARTILGHNTIIGVTCNNSKHLAFDAGEEGADYIAFGAFFPSETKETNHIATTDIITDWVEVVEIPCVAIGGINQFNCQSIIKAGVDFLAVSSSVWNHPEGPKTAVSEFNVIFDNL